MEERENSNSLGGGSVRGSMRMEVRLNGCFFGICIFVADSVDWIALIMAPTFFLFAMHQQHQYSSDSYLSRSGEWGAVRTI